MNDQRIQEFVARGDIRRRSINIPQAQSLIRAARECGEFAQSVPLDERSSTAVFKELYDAFQQLGDAKWWTLGFESYSHKASIELLKEADIPSRQLLQQLTRMMELRNDAKYRGYRIPLHETGEFLKLWQATHEGIIAWVR